MILCLSVRLSRSCPVLEGAVSVRHSWDALRRWARRRVAGLTEGVPRKRLRPLIRLGCRFSNIEMPKSCGVREISQRRLLGRCASF